MNPQELERVVFDLVEEDDYGLWEIAWRLKTVLGIDPSVDPTRPAEVLESLLRQHRVTVYVRTRIEGIREPLSSSGSSINLRDPSVWLAPSWTDVQFLIGLPDDPEAPIEWLAQRTHILGCSLPAPVTGCSGQARDFASRFTRRAEEFVAMVKELK